jgi:hypothetical protein
MLLGAWKNIEELEETLTLDELQAILKAQYEKEFRHHQFLAALKGHKMDGSKDKPKSDTKSKFEEIKARAEARLAGKTEEQAEFEFFGIDVI